MLTNESPTEMLCFLPRIATTISPIIKLKSKIMGEMGSAKEPKVIDDKTWPYIDFIRSLLVKIQKQITGLISIFIPV